MRLIQICYKKRDTSRNDLSFHYVRSCVYRFNGLTSQSSNKIRTTGRVLTPSWMTTLIILNDYLYSLMTPSNYPLIQDSALDVFARCTANLFDLNQNFVLAQAPHFVWGIVLLSPVCPVESLRPDTRTYRQMNLIFLVLINVNLNLQAYAHYKVYCWR